LFAAPRSFSQRTTSFIASQCQGIHRMPLRRLIALIIDTHPTIAGRQAHPSIERRLDLPQRERSVNTIRKTILLHHPSGSCALQDLSFAHALGAFRSGPSREDPNQNAPGDLLPTLDIFPTGKIGAGRSQPDECLFTMSNNTRWPGLSPTTIWKNVSSSGQGLDTNFLEARLPKKCNFWNWWSQTGSNRRPPECKSGALPAEL
jgi:hypothetical protein